MMDTSADISGEAVDKRQGIIHVNDLTYVLEPDLSIAVNATYKTHNFDRQKYGPANNAVCVLNSGADYVDTRRSYLHFSVKVGNGGWTPDPVEGGALNFIRDLTVSSRSGDELCRIRFFNQWCATTRRYERSACWMDTLGKLLFCGERTPASAADEPDTFKTYAKDDVIYFVVPMFMLGDFFAYGRLLPSMLMSGLRIDLRFEDAAKVCIKGQLQDYEVNDIFFNLRSVQLTDATQRALNELSAVNGLEIVYTDWETTIQNAPNERIFTEVRRACSRALKAYARFQVTSPRHEESGGDDKKSDNLAPKNLFRGVEFCCSQYQWQLGSLYFPQQPVRAIDLTSTTSVKESGCKQAYYLAMEASDKVHPEAVQLSAVTLDEYKKGYGAIACNLERTSLFNYSGIPINNSRILALMATTKSNAAWEPAGVLDKISDFSLVGNVERSQWGFPFGQVNIYLKYVKLARVFLNNVEIEH